MTRKILVVEDNELNRKLFVSLLREKSYEVSEASDGREAVEIIRNLSPSLVLMDIILPTVSGLEVLRTCRDEGLLENTKVYALTASVDDEIHDAGFDGIITKPVKIADFLRSVEKAFESQGG